MSLAARLEDVARTLRAGRYRDAAALAVSAATVAPAQPGELVALGRQLAYFNEPGRWWSSGGGRSPSPRGRPERKRISRP